LRFSSIIGPSADTPLTRFLKEPLAPVLMGFDPLMQVIHEEDVVDALVFAIENDQPGAFNIAAEGIMPLRRLMTLAAKVPLPVFHPFAYLGADVMGGMGARVGRYLPVPLDYLRYPWVGDLTKMREQLGFVPRYTAEEALREFAGEQRMRRYVTDQSDLTYDEERLRDTIERRRRARELDEMGSAEGAEG
jgi:UDP-glucose 4-epimerase